MKNFFVSLFFIFSFFTTSSVNAQKYAEILMDASTGEIIHQQDGDGHRYPASLTKMMTLYVIFECLRAKKISMETQFRVPSCAPIVEPCKLGLRTGQMISVRHIIMGLITKSANDASVTAAVGIGGSIEGFSKIMNGTARKLGMKRSHFYNPHGLPDTRQLSTARDMAILSRALIHQFPEYYQLFKTRFFTYMGHCHANHNRLLGQIPGLDGLKTGWFRRAGSNLAASAMRTINGKKRRYIAVVLGGANRFARDQRIKELIEQGFASTPNNTPQQLISKKAIVAESILYQKNNLPSANLNHDEDPIGDLIHSHKKKPKQKVLPKNDVIAASPLALVAVVKPLVNKKKNMSNTPLKAKPLGWIAATPTETSPYPSRQGSVLKKHGVKMRKVIRRIKRIRKTS